MKIRSLAVRIFRKTPLYQPLRGVWECAFCHPSWRSNRDRLHFYKQFIRRGSLVFDIGANFGDYTTTFLQLGANVVSVEPNPECVAALRRIQSKRLYIEPVAVGEATGNATLHVSSVNDLSSLSRDWINVAARSSRFHNVDWSKEITVSVSTIDALIQKYGEPDFIKIDVEGYEESALKGMSALSPYLSFEFNIENIDAVKSCLSLPLFLSGIECNLVVGEPRELFLDRWLPPEDVFTQLSSMTLTTYGDVLVRRT